MEAELAPSPAAQGASDPANAVLAAQPLSTLQALQNRAAAAAEVERATYRHMLYDKMRANPQLSYQGALAEVKQVISASGPTKAQELYEIGAAIVQKRKEKLFRDLENAFIEETERDAIVAKLYSAFESVHLLPSELRVRLARWYNIGPQRFFHLEKKEQQEQEEQLPWEEQEDWEAREEQEEMEEYDEKQKDQPLSRSELKALARVFFKKAKQILPPRRPTAWKYLADTLQLDEWAAWANIPGNFMQEANALYMAYTEEQQAINPKYDAQSDGAEIKNSIAMELWNRENQWKAWEDIPEELMREANDLYQGYKDELRAINPEYDAPSGDAEIRNGIAITLWRKLLVAKAAKKDQEAAAAREWADSAARAWSEAVREHESKVKRWKTRASSAFPRRVEQSALEYVEQVQRHEAEGKRYMADVEAAMKAAAQATTHANNLRAAGGSPGPLTAFLLRQRRHLDEVNRLRARVTPEVFDSDPQYETERKQLEKLPNLIALYQRLYQRQDDFETIRSRKLRAATAAARAAGGILAVGSPEKLEMPKPVDEEAEDKRRKELQRARAVQTDKWRQEYSGFKRTKVEPELDAVNKLRAMVTPEVFDSNPRYATEREKREKLLYLKKLKDDEKLSKSDMRSSNTTQNNMRGRPYRNDFTDQYKDGLGWRANMIPQEARARDAEIRKRLAEIKKKRKEAEKKEAEVAAAQQRRASGAGPAGSAGPSGSEDNGAGVFARAPAAAAAAAGQVRASQRRPGSRPRSSAASIPGRRWSRRSGQSRRGAPAAVAGDVRGDRRGERRRSNGGDK